MTDVFDFYPLSVLTVPIAGYEGRWVVAGGLTVAFTLLARVLRAAGDEIRIDKVDGGNAHNAIPREARAIITLPAEAVDTLRNVVQAQGVAIKEELERIREQVENLE